MAGANTSCVLVSVRGSDGQGKRHFWRYIDAKSYEVRENRYEVAQQISCLPDEPRYIGDQDVFLLQEKIIEHVLASEREVEAKAAAPIAVDPIQQTVTQEPKPFSNTAAWTGRRPRRASRFSGNP